MVVAIVVGMVRTHQEKQKGTHRQRHRRRRLHRRRSAGGPGGDGPAVVGRVRRVAPESWSPWVRLPRGDPGLGGGRGG